MGVVVTLMPNNRMGVGYVNRPPQIRGKMGNPKHVKLIIRKNKIGLRNPLEGERGFIASPALGFAAGSEFG